MNAPSLPISLVVAASLLLANLATLGATLFVSTGGTDSNPGTESQPWRTIQRGLTNAVPGDVLIVKPGIYDERNSSVRGGTNESHRITIRADGSVTNRGFSITHPFITVEGFQITGHSSADPYEGYVAVKRGGDFFQLLNSTIKDGIHLVLTNVVFTDNGAALDTISSPAANFLAAGFKAGQKLTVENAAARNAVKNRGGFLISAVAADTLTLSAADTLTTEGPTNAYLTTSLQYGIYLDTRIQGCIIRGNTFTNLSYDSAFIAGMNHLVESNIITATHGWDCLHYMGTNHVFRRNYIHNSPLVVYQISPDVFENWTTRYDNITFTNNWIDGFAGVMGAQKNGANDPRRLVYTHNVIRDVGRFSIVFPNARLENNLLLQVASKGNPVTSAAPHAARFSAAATSGAILRNNIFVGCGEGRTPDAQGWYEFEGNPALATLDHNFVASMAPAYSAKAGFNEGYPNLNGGDPGFVDISNPLGPDGIPFTDDDGVRLRADSKLRGAGAGGRDLGPYASDFGAPTLSVARLDDGRLRISWPISAAGFILQSRISFDTPWSEVPDAPKTTDSSIYVDVTPSSTPTIYRVAR